MRGRRCKRSKGFCPIRRLQLVVKHSRRLITTIRIRWQYQHGYHRRHPIRVVPEYRYPVNRETLPNCKVGKTLRSRKDHIPRYKIDRAGLEWYLLLKTKSVSSEWRSKRIDWISNARRARELHPEHTENMYSGHWWRI